MAKKRRQRDFRRVYRYRSCDLCPSSTDDVFYECRFCWSVLCADCFHLHVCAAEKDERFEEITVIMAYVSEYTANACRGVGEEERPMGNVDKRGALKPTLFLEKFLLDDVPGYRRRLNCMTSQGKDIRTVNGKHIRTVDSRRGKREEETFWKIFYKGLSNRAK